jgi:lysophospholipase L1-like esterase
MISGNPLITKHLCRVLAGACLRAARTMAALGLLILLAGCGSSDGGDDDGGPGPSPLPQAVRYTAVGASDAVGVGSSAPCLPFSACPDGMGYVPRVARGLRADGRDVTLTNLGVPGQVMTPAVEALSEQYGRDIPGNFVEQQMPFVRSGATLVTIFAGGNDTNAIATAISRGAGSGNVNAFIDAQVGAWAADYVALVQGIRQRAGSPQIIAINLPNFAGLPFTANRSTTERRWMQRISVGLGRAANALTAHNVRVVDMLCDARSYQRSNYSSDGFHPSDAGYAFMAAEVLQAIDTPPGQPAADCSFTRIVQ